MGDRGPVHPNVVFIVEIQELLPGEPVAIFSDDGVRDPKMENNVLDKAYSLLGDNFCQGLTSINLVNLSITTSRWVKLLGTFLKGPKRSRPHTTNNHAIGMV
jgi:hypothetical protein